MIGLLGRKLGMTQIFDGEGRQVPLTLLQVGPCYVTALRSQEKNGYTAVQLGFDGTGKEKSMNAARVGTFKKLKVPLLRFVREFRTPSTEGLELAAQLSPAQFEEGDFVDVSGVSIGKGFQGVVKRHHFKGGTGGRGTKMGREPGGIGSKAGGNGCRKKVPKGKRLPGHMGQDFVTVQNLKVIKVDADNNLLAVRGAVPGPEGTYLEIRMALKRASKDRKWQVLDKNVEKASAKSSSETSGQSESKSEDSKS
ncbi:MAG: 50S ribosomal protein L3 [Omnitrophica bacterium GWA2_52_12]|nr:MAG: 50S ribosomal protein L3 [Omnitrophica bacterium GWA2_52_12]